MKVERKDSHNHRRVEAEEACHDIEEVSFSFLRQKCYNEWLSGNPLDYFTRVTYGNCIRRYIADDDRTCTDGNIVADGHSCFIEHGEVEIGEEPLANTDLFAVKIPAIMCTFTVAFKCFIHFLL